MMESAPTSCHFKQQAEGGIVIWEKNNLAGKNAPSPVLTEQCGEARRDQPSEVAGK